MRNNTSVRNTSRLTFEDEQISNRRQENRKDVISRLINSSGCRQALYNKGSRPAFSYFASDYMRASTKRKRFLKSFERNEEEDLYLDLPIFVVVFLYIPRLISDYVIADSVYVRYIFPFFLIVKGRI